MNKDTGTKENLWWIDKVKKREGSSEQRYVGQGERKNMRQKRVADGEEVYREK